LLLADSAGFVFPEQVQAVLDEFIKEIPPDRYEAIDAISRGMT